METPVLAPPDRTVVEWILHTLSEAEQPLRIKQLWDRLPTRATPTMAYLKEILEEQIAQGKVFQFAPYRSKEPRYWTGDLEHYARTVILKSLTVRPRTDSELKAAVKTTLKGYADDRRKRLVRRLVEEGLIRELPPFIGGRTKRLSVLPPAPGEYLSDALEKIAAKLASAGVSREQVLSAAADLFAVGPASRAGSGAGAARLAAPTSFGELFQRGDSKSTVAVSAAADTGSVRHEASRADAVGTDEDLQIPRLREENMIVQRMLDVEPAAANGALVSLRDLRRALEFQVPDKRRFDRLILCLAASGRLRLHQHDDPASLTETRRNELVVNDQHQFFTGAVLST